MENDTVDFELAREELVTLISWHKKRFGKEGTIFKTYILDVLAGYRECKRLDKPTWEVFVSPPPDALWD